MKRYSFCAVLFAAAIMMTGVSCDDPHVKNSLRAPAYPLATIDPYTSAWSFSDTLSGSQVKHWTGKDFPLIGRLAVDGKVYRFMGIDVVEYSAAAPGSLERRWKAKYTLSKPAEDWKEETFDDSGWKNGTGAFGTIARHRESSAVTEWDTEEIWVRRSFRLDQAPAADAVYMLEYSNDDDAEFYVNGVRVHAAGCCNKEASVRLSDEAVRAMHSGVNLIAARCRNTAANGLIDFGLYVRVSPPAEATLPAVQTSVDVQATQTHYSFVCGGVNLDISFIAPMLPDDLDLLSRPVNYLAYEVKSNDGQKHDVRLTVEASSRWAVNTPRQPTEGKLVIDDKLLLLSVGTREQNVLGTRGDDVRIDWGYFYLGAEKRETTTYTVSDKRLSITENAGSTDRCSGKILLAYDDIYSIRYFDDDLRPYWNRSGKESFIGQLRKAVDEYPAIREACSRFDRTLMREAAAAGGQRYAELCALAYRQAFAAHKLVQSPDGETLWLSKENFSNGSIGTVDVTYPSAPLFLYYNAELAKGLLNHIFQYSESGRWIKPFPAHDVGTYPLATGQTYGDDMPVEEAGNMLILTAAIARMDGSADYASKHWKTLLVWADYLAEHGLDPANQLCTDDFAGHFAHNANLSVKAILGVASMGRLASMKGDAKLADKYTSKAREMAAQWIKMADDGDHFRLTFDRPGSWSQKYNLVWDKLLRLGVFPPETARKEIAFYLAKQNRYGLPLDNRSTYTKADWIVWSATLASDRKTFEAFIDPLHAFMNETVDRVPMSDWIYTDKPVHHGFRARSVVGGYFIKMLEAKLKD
jgi:hypothetical protein